MSTDSALEQRLRRRAKQQGFALRKSRIRNPNVDDQGGYMLVDPYTNGVVYGSRFELDLDDVEAWLAGEVAANGEATIRCDRCGRAPRVDEPLIAGTPRDWEGPPPVCPGCQYVAWHPHCTAVRVESGYGARLDIKALERGETVTVEIDGQPVVFRSLADLKALPEGSLAWCDYLDLSVSWVDGDDLPEGWSCASCGGTEFEGVHRDYPAGGLKGASFTAELEPDD